MTLTATCAAAHYWLVTPAYEREEGDPPGHCRDCLIPMPEHKASNANRRAYSEAQKAAQSNGLAKIAAARPKGSVHYNKGAQRWVARIRVKGSEKHLGTFKTREEADAAREQAEYYQGGQS